VSVTRGTVADQLSGVNVARGIHRRQCCRRRSCLLQHVITVILEPVGCDDVLGLLECERASTDFLVERVFNRVLRFGPDDVVGKRAP